MACFVNRIALLGAVVWVTASANLMMDFSWPEPTQNINRFPHESSCHYYYLMLSEEDITIEKCPDGQLFDFMKHSCISDKEHIQCWSRRFGKMKHGHIHINHKKHFKCPYPWGKYPNLHDCTKFHLCLHGKSMVKKCAPFELFDKISRKCIASIDAVCADKTDVVEHGYICPKTWGSFTYSKDCSKYYECLQRKPSLRTCQKGNLFDDRLSKCAPKDHVYCGLRHNPYEKVSSDVPETSSVQSTILIQKSTTLGIDATTLTAKEKIISTTQETVTSLKDISSTHQESSPTSKDVSSTPQKLSSTFKDVSSTPQESSLAVKDVSSTPAPSNQPIANEISNSSSILKDNNKQDTNIVSANITVVEKLEEHQKTSDGSEGASGGNEIPPKMEEEEIKMSSETASDDESESLKKDVSTEEKDPNNVFAKHEAIQEIEKIPEANRAISKTVCLPDDSMCITEKDGTVVKCFSSKDLQPHPKDERRFLDCTGSKIEIYACPPNLTFHPDTKKCRWQFIMSSD